MNPRVKEKWLAALRSGEYKQEKDTLRIGDCFCCLGVLCDLQARETDNLHWWEEGCGGYNYFGHDLDLPAEVTDWAGLELSNPLIPVEIIRKIESAPLVLNKPAYSTVETIDLAGINDSGVPFSEIADLIEEAL
jgi:hypothetical protein